MIKNFWIFEQGKMLVNEFILDRPIVLFNVAVLVRLFRVVPVMGHCAFLQMSLEITVKFRTIIRLDGFNWIWEDLGKLCKKILGIPAVGSPVAPGKCIAGAGVYCRNDVALDP